MTPQELAAARALDAAMRVLGDFAVIVVVVPLEPQGGRSKPGVASNLVDAAALRTLAQLGAALTAKGHG